MPQTAGLLPPGLHPVQPDQIALFRRASAATVVNELGGLQLLPADQPRWVDGALLVEGAATNLCFDQVDPLVAAPGVYGNAYYLKTPEQNPHDLQPGEVLTISAWVHQDAAALAAGGEAALFLWFQDADTWRGSVSAVTANLGATRLQATLALPASAADMWFVGVGVYHLGANATWAGVAEANHVQVERGTTATSTILHASQGGPSATRAADVAVLLQQPATEAAAAALRMDAALRWDAAAGQFDLVIDPAAADLQAEDTLLTAVVLSLMCDSTAPADGLPAGADRRGWWADAYASSGDSYGSQLWLLAREKQLPATIARARAYILQALQWLVDDGLATAVDAVVFAPRLGWLTAQVQIALDGGSRRYRFLWSDDRQAWTLEGDA